MAVLLGQPEEYAYGLFLKGFIKEAFELDMDVCVFAMYIKYQNSPARSVGDSSIFKLVNYDAFDCIIVLADSIQTKGVANNIEESLHKSYKGKVLFVDQESKYFPSIHIDNYNPEKKIVDHLIEVHGKRDIAFLTGKAWHPHSKIRLQAYRDSLTQHGIKVNESRIFYGDFWYTSGESLADSLTAKDNTLPEAVAFANDHMALGFAKRMDELGIRVPEDIAIVGFDSNTDGKHSPVPLTSVPIPAVLEGRNSAHYADALINGREFVPLEEDPEIFIGGTCGCGCDSAKEEYYRRDRWDTELSLGSIFSPFNYMDDDLLAQNTYAGLIAAIFGNLHLIRGFDSFNLCLNPELGGAKELFEDRINHVICCGRLDENRDRIQTDVSFPKSQMLPELYEKREKPSVYYFMPLYYEESVFGYGAVRYDGRVEMIRPEYRSWLRSVSRGIECYRRSDELIGSSKLARKAITTDNLTGLLNYKGFLESAETFLHLMHNNGDNVGALAIDIKDLSDINDNYGRTEGDNAIVTAASVLESVFNSRNCLCFRAGNDELVALRITSATDDSELLTKKDILLDRLDEVQSKSDLPYNIVLYYGTECGSPQTSEELERLVNIAIGNKNISKGYVRNTKAASLSEEDMQRARIVKEILDSNLIKYHFQPIVDARTAEVVAYEALMRATVTPYLDPPTVLRFAEFYGRLYDVERATFAGVIKEMGSNEGTLSGGKKIFINSIPGYLLKGEDLKALAEHMNQHPSSIVVELTEHAELEDNDLKSMKQLYEKMGIETAVDDYGTGYSNVSNLLRYQPNYVKIDRALLSGIEDSPQKRHFVKEIIEFSHDNGITALAEGVETSEELKTVIMLGADLVQGYYLGMPAPEMVQSINSQVVDEIHRFDALRNSKR